MPKLSEKTLAARAAVAEQLAYLDSVAADPSKGAWARLKATSAANAIRARMEREKRERLAATRAKAAEKRATKLAATQAEVSRNWLPQPGEDGAAYAARIAKLRARDHSRPPLGRKAFEADASLCARGD